MQRSIASLCGYQGHLPRSGLNPWRSLHLLNGKLRSDVEILPHRVLVRLNALDKQQAIPADEDFDWVARNQEVLRQLPLASGICGILGVLVNRIVSGIAPVADAGSSQSRADVLVIGMSGVLLLTGLQWLSLRPRALITVEPDGFAADYLIKDLPPAARDELRWAWQAVKSATRCRGLLVFFKGICICHLGIAKTGTVPGEAAPGPLCEKAVASGVGNYLANLVLYPGRFEFTKFFPDNTQGVLLQPLGESAVMVLATDTQRGFGQIDQAWAASLAEKLDTTLDGWSPPGLGFKQPT